MACTSPLHGYRAPGGQIVTNRKSGWIDRPVTVSCGRCTSCRLRRASDWAVRCVHEASLHERNCFITLTYDDEHVPHDFGLDVSHWQKFAKRLRKRFGPFRFFHAGEYGDRYLRPHYHAVLFGLDFRHDQVLYKQKREYAWYTSPSLAEVWGQGNVLLGEMNYLTAAYCARYTMKKIGGPRAESHYERVDTETGEVFNVRPEYCTMSRRPGIGSGWLEKYKEDVYPDDFVVDKGRKFRVPEFYDRKMEEMDPAFIAGVKSARIRRAKENPMSPDRLYARRKIVDSQQALVSREL